MSDPRAQASSEAQGEHLVLYDGVCGLCNWLTTFLLGHDPREVFAFAALQTDVGAGIVERAGGEPRELTTFYVLANHRSSKARLLTKGRAAVFVARQLGWPWKAFGVFGVLPTTLLDLGYSLIARNRYRLFGRSEACLAPLPEYRRRFIDASWRPS